MKIIYNKYLPVKGFMAVNLFGLVFAREECKPFSEDVILHEAIHTAQIKEMGYLFFYLWYLVEWLIRLAQYRSASQAYRNISFEREAYEKMFKKDYLTTRKHYQFLIYL